MSTQKHDREYKRLKSLLIMDRRRVASKIRQVRRKIEKRKILNRLVPDRTCSLCLRTFLEDSSWVIVVDRAICRSCQVRTGMGLGPSDRGLRWEVNGPLLRSHREDRMMSQQGLADRLVISQSVLSRLENSMDKKIRRDLWTRLHSVFPESVVAEICTRISSR